MAELGFELEPVGSRVHVLEYWLRSKVTVTLARAKGHDFYPYLQLKSEGRQNKHAGKCMRIQPTRKTVLTSRIY